MAPRGRGGKFSKPSRGGGKHFSRNIQITDKDGNPVSMWRDPADDPSPSSSEEGSSEEESSDDSGDEGPSNNTKTPNFPSQPNESEMTREERRALARAKKAAGAARRAGGPAQPGDLPPSDDSDDEEARPAVNSIGSTNNDKEKERRKLAGSAPAPPPAGGDSEDEDPDLPSNPNYVKGQKKEVIEADPDGERPGERGGELSRREREAVEAQQARERYMKLHAEGKTDEARADLARLAIVKERREAEKERREAEKEEKAEVARQRAEERERKLAKGGTKKKGKK